MNMKNKKTIYILAAMFLGFLLSLIAHAELEMWYLRQMLSAGAVPPAYGPHEFLPPQASYALSICGLIFGYVLGQRWWQIVYIEHRHWKKWKK
jgi:hypothetical protein